MGGYDAVNGRGGGGMSFNMGNHGDIFKMFFGGNGGGGGG